MPDLADVAGHADARFALEVAAAGGHHLLLHGPPGAGKTYTTSHLVASLIRAGKTVGIASNGHKAIGLPEDFERR